MDFDFVKFEDPNQYDGGAGESLDALVGPEAVLSKV
jgi:hypothetical protein